MKGEEKKKNDKNTFKIKSSAHCLFYNIFWIFISKKSSIFPQDFFDEIRRNPISLILSSGKMTTGFARIDLGQVHAG
jgi:hypothetical protein